MKDHKNNQTTSTFSKNSKRNRSPSNKDEHEIHTQAQTGKVTEGETRGNKGNVKDESPHTKGRQREENIKWIIPGEGHERRQDKRR